MPVIELRAALEAAWPSSRLERLYQIQRMAAGLSAPTYLVGGVARDLLLGRPPGDLDLVVQAGDETDALAGPRLAQALARRHGGQVAVHAAFGTSTWVDVLGEPIDFATARTEIYAFPGALPTVTPATSILADLSRRDFTFNAMAIRVDGDLFGEMLDPFQGQHDVFARQVQVLHAHSLSDDPTRLFRAVRYEQRLGFYLSGETLAQLPAGLAAIPALSGERVRHELELIIAEPMAVAMLARLEALAALATVCPAMSWGGAQTDRAQVIASLPLPDWRLDEPLDTLSIFLALLLAQTEPVEARAALQRLSASRQVTQAVTSAVGVQLASAAPSEVVAQLDSFSTSAVVAAYVLYPELRTLLHHYLSRWRFVNAELTGDDLVALGLKPGPDFARWLWGLRAARLDGTVADRGGELALIRLWTQTE